MWKAETGGQRKRRMIIISRMKNESIMIGDEISVYVVDIRGDRVRLGIEAPREAPSHRHQVSDALQRLPEASRADAKKEPRD